MKIFFTASLRAKKASFNQVFKLIYEEISQDNEVVAGHLFNQSLNKIQNLSTERRLDYYHSVYRDILDSDILIAEISYPSINVGYEVSLALESQKQIILLYTGTDSPLIAAFLEGYEDADTIQLIQYTGEANLISQLKHGLKTVASHLDKRFTILLPTTIINHLDEISRTQRIPKSVYIRQLIENDMKSEFN